MRGRPASHALLRPSRASTAMPRAKAAEHTLPAWRQAFTAPHRLRDAMAHPVAKRLPGGCRAVAGQLPWVAAWHGRRVRRSDRAAGRWRLPHSSRNGANSQGRPPGARRQRRHQRRQALTSVLRQCIDQAHRLEAAIVRRRLPSQRYLDDLAHSSALPRTTTSAAGPVTFTHCETTPYGA